MPVPKRRVSKSRRNMRRAHLALDPIAVVFCDKCEAPRLSHSVCERCGSYRGRTLRASFLKDGRHSSVRSSASAGDFQ